MESSPLGEIVKALSLLQQTQHQALLDVQRENQARFEALAQRWLLLAARDSEEVLDLVVLEQFIAHLPEKTAARVQCHQPESLDEATRLAEAHLAAYSGKEGGCSPQALSLLSLSPSPHPPLSISRNPLAATHGLPSLSAQGAAAEPTRAGVKPGQVCWRCGEPRHFQDQCHHMEVGTLVRVPTSPPTSPDRAGAYRIPFGVLVKALVEDGSRTTIGKAACAALELDKLPRPSVTAPERGGAGDSSSGGGAEPDSVATPPGAHAAHNNPMAGHLGQEKTLNRLMDRFYWPGIHVDVRRWCASCRECQLVNLAAIPKAPLHPLPLIEVPFKRIGMDLVGPLDRSARGYRFVLVLVDYATQYPEAVPLRNILARTVAEALFKVISRVGIPKEILTDQGITFMSRTLHELYKLLGVKLFHTSVYHPQTNGLVEHFNQTLKNMIRKFVHEDAKNWDKWLEPLFAVREVPQASSGFSPFELLYGRKPRGILDIIKEHWEEGPPNSKNEIQYVLDLRAPATFQRLMDRILRPHCAYATAYLDDIIIYSNDWQRHVQHLRAVLRSLRRAGLTANPKKCAIGRVEVRYLGFHLGHGQVRPQIDKTAAIATCPRPKTKKEVRRFLGLAGYYHRFIPNYVDVTSPLTNLTKKGAPDPVQWMEQCQQAVTRVKAALCGGPLLHSPDFTLPFVLQTDMSDRGLGAVLSQVVEGEDRPVEKEWLSNGRSSLSAITC
ncbi:uncharacterized protein LOC118801669 [Colossoma macropomum]|uniref:uncharacterized protein LOC118801669 n=1 Tax=Colossoma macropomum TaxID=42526 RepID=UPI0018640A2A|nr:uncharacterized protein LOC118801669 [Colossoma macropomum]